MFSPEDYQEAASHESMGGKSTIGVKVLLTREVGFADGIAEDGSSYERLFFTDITLSKEECAIVSRHCEELKEQILMSRYRRDPQVILNKDNNQKKILACFPNMWVTIPVSEFVKEIANQYCSRHCCVEQPWLVVTTNRGDITIGWRRRVISIDWSQSHVKATARELFPLEDVTKTNHLIHAWTYEKATEYIKRILSHVYI